MNPTRVAVRIAVVAAAVGIAAPARSDQPDVGLVFDVSTPIGGNGSSVTVAAGPQPVSLSDSFNAPAPPVSFDPCYGSAGGVAGEGMPSATALIERAFAHATCPGGDFVGPTFDSYAEANGVLLYQVKGPAATAQSPATLYANLHGTITAATDFGSTPNQAENFAQVGINATASPAVGSANAASLGKVTSDFIGYSLANGDPTLYIDQTSGTTARFAIDHTFQTDFTLLGWVAMVRSHLFCEANTKGQYSLVATFLADASCEVDSGDTSAYLGSSSPSVVLEPVPPLRATRPRSAAYLSPAAGPIEAFLGASTIPSIASRSGDLGQGATGDGSASADLPQMPELVDTTGAASHVDQSAVTANASATVASEGMGAASLLYRVDFLNGATMSDYPQGLPVTLQVPSVHAMLSASKGLDPSIVQHVSLQITLDVQGAPFFHFVTLSLGSSNEDPPGVSGDLGFLCVDASTPTAQVCMLSGSPNDEPLGIRPDDHADVVVTVQTDCATSLAHPSGPLPAAHLACDASHTVTAKLVSRDANVQLTPVPEPGAGALAIACLGPLAALAGRRKRARRAC